MVCEGSFDYSSLFPDTGRVQVLEAGQVGPSDVLCRPYYPLNSALVQLGGRADGR